MRERSADAATESLFARLLDEYTDRRNRGEEPDVEEYARRHPEIADLIRDGFALVGFVAPATPPPDSTPSPDIGPHSAPAPPRLLGDFEILDQIGRGGMGVVFRAVQLSLGREVALKVLPGAAFSSPALVERFRREARAAALLHHTNIVPVFAVGEEGGSLYYAMQLIRGRGLDGCIRRADGADPAAAAPLPPSGTPEFYRAAARIGLQVAEALAHAHAHGVLHRDVKPSNVLLDESGTAWLTDFGLAKVRGADGLTDTGAVVGTLRYLAPESLNREADARSDVYGLGATLYELLTGRLHIAETDRDRFLKQLTEGDPTPPRRTDRRVPRDLETVVLTALAREPGRRYASAADLAEDLRRFLDGRPVLARRAGPVARAWRWCRRNPAVALLLACVFTLLAALATGGTVAAIGFSAKNKELGQSLRDTEDARTAERTAKENEIAERKQAQRSAWDALLARAEIAGSSDRVGRRAEALAALGEAARLLPDLGRLPADVVRLRSAATAALQMIDLAPDGAWVPDDPREVVIAVDRDGARAATIAPGGRLYIRTLAGGSPPWSVEVPPDLASFFTGEFSPDGRYFALHWVRQQKATVTAWEIGRAEPRLTVKAPRHIQFLADGHDLAVLREDVSLGIYSLDTGAVLRDWLLGTRHASWWVEFSPDRQRYAAVEAQLTIRDAATHALRHTFPIAASRARWSADGTAIALYDAHNVVVCDATAREVLYQSARVEGGFRDLAITPSGDLVAWTTMDGELAAWDLRTRRPLAVGAVRGLGQLRFTPDGRLLAFGPGGVRAWRVVGRDECRTLPGPGWDHADGELLGGLWATFPRGDGQALQVWDLETGRASAPIPFPKTEHVNVGIDPSRECLLTLHVDLGAGTVGEIRRWPVALASGVPVVGPHEVVLSSSPEFNPQSVPAVSIDGRLLVTAGHSTLSGGNPPTLSVTLAVGEGKQPDRPPVLWPLTTPRPVRPSRHFGAMVLSLSPGGRWVAGSSVFVSEPTKLVPAGVWDLADGAKKVEAITPRPPWRGTFSPDGRWLVESTPKGYTVREVGSWRVVRELPLREPETMPPPVACTPDGWVIVPLDRREIVAIDPSTGEEVATFPTWGEQRTRLRASADGRWLVCAGPRHRVQVWDLARVRAKWAELGVPR